LSPSLLSAQLTELVAETGMLEKTWEFEEWHASRRAASRAVALSRISLPELEGKTELSCALAGAGSWGSIGTRRREVSPASLEKIRGRLYGSLSAVDMINARSRRRLEIMVKWEGGLGLRLSSLCLGFCPDSISIPVE
jgi:hypothetical protein